jgi:hypothetical protein
MKAICMVRLPMLLATMACSAQPDPTIDGGVRPPLPSADAGDAAIDTVPVDGRRDGGDATIPPAADARADGGMRPGADGGAAPDGLGWHVLPGTRIRPHCPPNEEELRGGNGCQAVVSAWNGGIADTKRNQLVVWGGGHNDWYGNEVYALDVGTRTMARINDPSPVTNVSTCPFVYPDGRPSSRHTYGGLAYAANVDAMFAFGGSRANCGNLANDAWLLDLSTLSWTQKLQTTPALAGPGAIADYDAMGGKIFLQVGDSVHRYDPNTNAWTAFSSTAIDYHLNGAIDPVARKFFLFGNASAYAIDISGNDAAFAINPIAAANCNFKNGASPGVAYDSTRGLLLGWSGGDTVYSFSAVTGACTSQTFAGGPGAAQPNGTFGRFRYFPALGVFALVNDIDQDAYVLRMSP